MALTASDLITAAKQRTFGSRGKQKLSDPALLGELAYQDSLIVQMFSQNAPDLLADVTETVTVSAAENISGYTLEDGIHYRDFTHIDSTDEDYVPINLLQRQYRQSGVSAPAGMLKLSGAAGVFFPIDPEGKRWDGSSARNWFEEDEGHEFSYSYVPIPGTLSALSDTLVSPDMAREVLVTSLMVAILLTNPNTPTERLQTVTDQRTVALNTLVMQAMKFRHPVGQSDVSHGQRSETEWVHDEVSG